MASNKKLYKNLKSLLDEGLLALVKDKHENLYAKIYIEDELAGMELIGSKQFIPLFKELYFGKFKDFLGNQDMQLILEMLAMEGRKVTEKIKLCKRIYRDEKIYLYELNMETNTVVWIENGVVSIENIEDVCFKHSQNDANQVIPDLSVGVGKLFLLLRKHFKFQSDSDLKLFMLYLVSCFLGLEEIQHPILVLKGEKGASKSTTMRMLSKIISPQITDLSGQFNNLDDLQLNMANSYMVTLDNMREIPKKVSDVLCRVVTGGSYQKRKLYTDNEMLNLDLNCLVVISSIVMPIKEPDLVDRSLILELQRIDAKERISENIIWKEFNKDLPQILGSIFKIVAKVLQDTTPIENVYYIRLVDFHQACLRIGKAYGLKYNDVNALLYGHRSEVNHTLICDDVAIGCFVQFMIQQKKFSSSMTQLLYKLYEVAERKEIPLTDMPKQANQLSRKLNRVKSNLEETYNIYFEIHNIGMYREIVAKVKKDYE